MQIIILVALILAPSVLIAGTESTDPPKPSYPLIQSNDKGSLVLFDDAGSKLQTNVYGLEFLGELETNESEMPFLVFEGMDCDGCGNQKFIYMVRKDGAHPMRFVYPGKVRDARSRRLLFDGRAFFGKCLRRGKKNVFLMHQKEKLDRRRYLQTSVYLAEPSSEGVKERILVRGRPRLSHVQRQVRRKKCFEIKGKNRLTISARRLGPV